VELLVVITVIGILVALMLPAVNSAREAGRQVECKNNLKQMSLACLAHVEAHGIFPGGGLNFWTDRTWYSPGVPAIAPAQHLGWAYQILPFIEEGNLWISGTSAEDVGKVLLSWCYCPTRRRPMLLIDDQCGGRVTRGGMDYAGNGGCDSSVGEWGIWGNGADAPITRCPDVVSHAQITDGVSNTLLLGEKCLNVSVFPYNQADDDGGWIEGWDFDTIRWGVFQPRPDMNQGPIMPISAIRHDGNSHGGSRYAFGSSHPSQFMSALCDGSVRTIAFSISSNVFKNLSSRNDGAVIDLTKL